MLIDISWWNIIMAIIQIQGFKCEVCGHIWIPRNRQSKQSPIACPKCKSPDWNKFQGKKQWLNLGLTLNDIIYISTCIESFVLKECPRLLRTTFRMVIEIQFDLLSQLVFYRCHEICVSVSHFLNMLADISSTYSYGFRNLLFEHGISE